MPETSLSTILTYLTGALLMSGLGLLAVGVFVSVNRRFGKWTVALINPLVLVAICVTAFLSGRDITNAEYEIATAAGTETPQLVWFLRLVTAIVLGVCLARFVSASQRHEVMPREGRGLFLAYLMFFTTNFVLNNLFGAKPIFDQKLIYPVLVMIAVYCSRNRDARLTVDATKAGLLLFCVASCAAIYLLPRAAVQRDYASIIPMVGFRLWGLGSNPNSTGPLALVLLLLLTWRPFRSTFLQLLGFGTGIAVLVLSQSKTSWLAAAVAFPTLWYGQQLYDAARRGRSRTTAYPMRNFLRPILFCVVGLAGVAALAYVQLHNPLAHVSSDEQEQMTTLTGRTEIWAVALQTWKANPLFGYGAAMWDDEFRRAVGMDFAYNAHNQFLQSLSVAGGLGLAGLLIYTLVLFRYAFAANTATRGLSLALFWVIFVRFFTEAPFNMAGIFSGEFVTHLLLFTLVLTKGRHVYFGSRQPMSYQPLQHLQYR